MVRSHIGNVVCRKALCVRVASSPPIINKNESVATLSFLFIIVYLIFSTIKIASSPISSIKSGFML